MRAYLDPISVDRGTRRTLPAWVAAAFVACWSPHTALALPVIPGVSGFGVDTPAGRGGTVYRVTNLNEGGGGSLGACVAARGPRVCIFEVSGTIRLTKDLVVNQDRVTIAGQTAPSPGIMLRGAALRIQASDVLVQHLRVRAGDDPSGPDPENRDALKIEGNAANPVSNVVIDHCSFSWAIDEVATAWHYWDNVTYFNNIFAEPLRESLHPNPGRPDSPGQGFGVLFGAADGRASMVGNLLAHQVARNPLSRARHLVFVNNVVYNRANLDVGLQTENGRATFNSIVGNVFIRGPDYTRDVVPVQVFTSGDVGLPSTSRVHVKDNQADGSNGDGWSVVSLRGSQLRSAFEAATPPAWPAGLVPRSTANGAVYEWVLASAGARPLDRDAVDRRVVQSVRDRGGRIINCVAADGSERCQRNAGGWPVLPLHTRALTLPQNPHALAASGYTNLEVWLHSMSAALEGGVVRGKVPRAPTNLRAQ